MSGKSKISSFFAHGEFGFCDVVFAKDGSRVLTCGGDALARVHPPLGSTGTSAGDLGRFCKHPSGCVTAIAASPLGDCFVTAVDEKNAVYRWNMLSAEESESELVTRMVSPPRTLAFSPTGACLAVAGDDGSIKIVSLHTESVRQIEQAHNGPVKCVCFDPSNEFFASSGCDGTVKIWESQVGSSKELVTTLRVLVSTKAGVHENLSDLAGLHWEPTVGSCLAIPVATGGISLFERGSWKEVKTLRFGDRPERISLVRFSPNGKYCAGAVGRTIRIWRVVDGECFESYRHSEHSDESVSITGMVWHPFSNALVFIDSTGYCFDWRGVVPTTWDPPSDQIRVTVDPPVVVPQILKSKADDRDGEEEEEIVGSGTTPAKRKGKKLRHLQQTAFDDFFDGEDLARKRMRLADRGFEEEEVDLEDRGQSFFLISHPVFQPGGTGEPEKLGTRFLCWNLDGKMISRREATINQVEVSFSDAGIRKFQLRDEYRFSVGTMNMQGGFFAAPSSSVARAVVHYRQFSDTWDQKFDWTLQLLENEEPIGVAIGWDWCAVSTTKSYVRVFGRAGSQQRVFSLPSPPVCIAGHTDGSRCVVVVNSGAMAFGEDESPLLSFTLYDFSDFSIVASGHLPLSPASYLRWVGFDKADGVLFSYDSEGICRGFDGSSWVPVWEAPKEEERTAHWIVGVDSMVVQKRRTSFILHVRLKVDSENPSEIPYPRCDPSRSPLVDSSPLAAPVLPSGDARCLNDESSLILESLRLPLLEKKCASDAASNEKRLETCRDMDVSAIRLETNAIASERAARALEYAGMLHFEKFFDIAIRVARDGKDGKSYPELTSRIERLKEKKRIDQQQNDSVTPKQGRPVASASPSPKVPLYKPREPSSARKRFFGNSASPAGRK